MGPARAAFPDGERGTVNPLSMANPFGQQRRSDSRSSVPKALSPSWGLRLAIGRALMLWAHLFRLASKVPVDSLKAPSTEPYRKVQIH
jgi:hypothetical protein